MYDYLFCIILYKQNLLLYAFSVKFLCKLWFTKRNPVIRFTSSSELRILVIVVKVFHLCKVSFWIRTAAQALQSSYHTWASTLVCRSWRWSLTQAHKIDKIPSYISFTVHSFVSFSRFYCYVRVSHTVPVVILSDDPTRNETFAKARILRKFSRADFQSRFPYESYYRYRYVLPLVLHVQKPISLFENAPS